MVQLATTDATAGLWVLILLVVALSSSTLILDDLVKVPILSISTAIIGIATVVVDVDILASRGKIIGHHLPILRILPQLLHVLL